MAYKSSPRPTFAEPAAIPYAAVTRHLWGDAGSGEVADWIYVSSDHIHQLVFALPPGGAFRHSHEYRTIFAADLVYTVLSGVMVICNPETGEAHPVNPGESAFFRRDTWHHVVNHSIEPLRVLEYFAPPPSQGTSGSYARQRPYLETPKYGRDDWLGRFPMERATLQNQITVLRDADCLWRLEGDQQQMLVGLVAATEHLMVGKASLIPGKPTHAETHAGDESLYVTEGTLNIHLPEFDGQRWHELNPGDGFYLPAGTPHRYFNMTDKPARWMFGIAPGQPSFSSNGA
jgi:quercetin dioxygenase-like cupin family protein